MSVTQLKTVAFGKSKSGLTGEVGYTVYTSTGTISQPRTAIGVFEVTANTGTYASEITFENNFNGVVVWDVTTSSGLTVYASEEYNGTTQTSVALESIAADVEFIKDIEGGKWQIDRNTKQMVFYKPDNTTEIAPNKNNQPKGKPSEDLIYKRERV